MKKKLKGCETWRDVKLTDDDDGEAVFCAGVFYLYTTVAID